MRRRISKGSAALANQQVAGGGQSEEQRACRLIGASNYSTRPESKSKSSSSQGTLRDLVVSFSQSVVMDEAPESGSMSAALGREACCRQEEIAEEFEYS